MRIGLVTHYMPPQIGRIELVAESLYNAYRAAGFQVRWVAARDPDSAPASEDGRIKGGLLERARGQDIFEGRIYSMNGREALARVRNYSWLLSQLQDLILRSRDSFSQGEFARLYRSIRPYTVSSNARLRGLYRAVRHVVTENILGDIVECGAGRGGSAALLGLTLKQLDAQRTLWVFDTFEGLPPPTLDDPDFEMAKRYTGACRGDLDEVVALFERLGIFALPASGVEKIGVLHIDGDWYESVKVCLEHLYDRVTSGGIIQIDDYGHWAGARKAVDEFLRQHPSQIVLQELDYTGRQFVKP